MQYPSLGIKFNCFSYHNTHTDFNCTIKLPQFMFVPVVRVTWYLKSNHHFSHVCTTMTMEINFYRSLNSTNENNTRYHLLSRYEMKEDRMKKRVKTRESINSSLVCTRAISINSEKRRNFIIKRRKLFIGIHPFIHNSLRVVQNTRTFYLFF